MGDPAKKDNVQCLTDDVIRQFLMGELDDGRDQVVADHLEHCGSCQRLTMSFLSVDDLCLPWVTASHRDTIDLVRQPADTVTLNRLNRIAGTCDRPARSNPELSRVPEMFQREAVPKRIDKYEIVTTIGQGGMGTVYLGIDHDLSRECAIKVLRESRSRDSRAIERARREMHAVGSLTHRNIVSVLNAGQLDDGRTFLAMEFLRGSDLQSWVQEHGPLPPEDACRVIIDAAHGLQHAHQQGLIHRDVKPSNLFRTDEDDIKVLDFGLVQLSANSMDRVDALTETGLVLGTVDFMSPEQALDSRSVDPRADIYSLGCTLAWLLSGKPLFPGRSVTRILLAHRDDPAPELETLQPNAPSGLDAVFQKMVAKQHEDRFRSMEDAINALRPFARLKHDEPVTKLSSTSETQLPASTPAPASPTSAPTGVWSRTALGWLSVLVILGIVITLVVRQSDETAPEIRIDDSEAVSAAEHRSLSDRGNGRILLREMVSLPGQPSSRYLATAPAR